MPVLPVATLQTYFTRHTAVQKAYLFGSFARGSATESSDVDILLELKKPVTISLLDIATMQIELSEQLNRSVDILTSEGVSPHIKPFIDKEKVVIYERENG